MTVVNFLKHGRENAIRADVLAAAMGTTPRGLRRLIMQATYTQKRIPNTHRQNAPPKMHSDAPQMIPIIRMCCEWLKPK